MKTVMISALCLSVMGCGGRSAIVPNGADTYTVIVSGRSGFVSSGDLKISAYQQANARCQSMGRTLEVIEEQEQRAGVLGKFPEAQLKFRCLPKA